MSQQILSDITPAVCVQRLVQTYPARFGADFWEVFALHIAPRLPPRPVLVDLGCGPGLLLQALAARYPQATLYGYDASPAMVAYARQLPWAGARPTLTVHDVTTQPLPLATGTVHLVSMTAVLHLFDDPFPVLAEVHRLLAPTGLFLLHDWIRQPLSTYLAAQRAPQDTVSDSSLPRAFRHFPVHNKYTTADWQWLLQAAEFAPLRCLQICPAQRLFVAIPTGS
ncbi:MAG: class I SAM-dependent methyltransferase [Candidatus Tectimicrobiota bacterium]